jgi:hypothetical protein
MLAVCVAPPVVRREQMFASARQQTGPEAGDQRPVQVDLDPPGTPKAHSVFDGLNSKVRLVLWRL